MSTADHDAVQHIIYISIPEGWEQTINDFTIDPAVLLPVETPPDQEDWSVQDLSWEAIISAMLKILAYQPDHEHTGYYRDFVLAVKPDIINELSETGVVKARNRDFALAEEIFRALAGLEPENPISQMNLATVFEQRAQAFADVGNDELHSEYADATYQQYHRLFSMDDVPTAAHLNAGFFYAKQHDYDKALQHLQTFSSESDDEELVERADKLARSIETQNLQDTRFKEAYDYISMGQEEHGLELIYAFLEENPGVWNGWFLLGWGLRRLKRFSDAAAAFEKSIELYDQQPDSYNELSICLIEQERFPEAQSMLEKALELDPLNTKVISNLGILALKTGDDELARGFFQTVLEYDPEDPIARQYLEHMEHGL